MEISHGHTIVVRPLGEGTEWKRANEAGDPVALYRVSGIEVPVVMPWLDGPLVGSTVDPGEASLRALVDGLPPELGTRAHTGLTIGDATVDVRGAIVRPGRPGAAVAAVHAVPRRRGEGRRRAAPAGLPGAARGARGRPGPNPVPLVPRAGESQVTDRPSVPFLL